MTRFAHARRFTPNLSALETRDVPAGDLTVLLDGSTLVLTGDADPNSVVVRGKSTPGVVEVQGIKTTLNGGAAKLTFTGVDAVYVDAGGGNDTVRTQGLKVSDLTVYGGAGDDTIDLAGTSNSGVNFNLSVYGDDYLPAEPTPNGNDTIRVSNTTVISNDPWSFNSFYFLGDQYSPSSVGGLDRITVSNTRLEVPFYSFFIESDIADSGPGNVVTVTGFHDRFIESGEAVHGYGDVGIFGSTGADTVVIHDMDMYTEGRQDANRSLGVVTTNSYWPWNDDGGDSVTMSNVTVNPVVTGGWGEGLFNQTGLFVGSTKVRMDNVHVEGGGYFYDPDWGFDYYTFGEMSVVGTDIDIRNTSLHTNGVGGFSISDPQGWSSEGEYDSTVSLTNVHVSASSGHDEAGYLGINTFGGNDAVRMVNVSSRFVAIDLGAGDDTLVALNCFTSDAGPDGWYGTPLGMSAGDGNDTISLTNCTFADLTIDMGDGDDTLALTNNTFANIHVDGGLGSDRLLLWNNTGLFTIDGFEL